MRIKICGLTHVDQAVAIAEMGASVLGFICVQQSPRYISPTAIGHIAQVLPPIDRFGVFANAPLKVIKTTVQRGQLSGVQLHGHESPADCQRIRLALPNIELIKALRIQSSQDLKNTTAYAPYIDTFLLDAYHPQQLGGTGQTLDWETLKSFRPDRPWFLAGGLRPENIAQALSLIAPDGIDLSSGVEIAPGNKDLAKVATLLDIVRHLSPTHPAKTTKAQINI